MTTITFDTQELVIELEHSGFTRQQSETVVSVLKKSQGELATTRDIEELRLATKRDIESLRQDMKVSLSELKVELIKWVTGALIAQAAVIATLVKLL